MNLFKAVKQSVTTRQAAEHYGIKASKNGMALCPFHKDRHPSMKVDSRFYCFACGASGDVIDFVSRLYGLDGKESAIRLAEDFGILYEEGRSTVRNRSLPPPRRESPEQKFKEAGLKCFRILADYRHLLEQWKMDFTPDSPECEWHPCFIEALQNLTQVEYLLDILIDGEIQERAALIMDYGKEMRTLERRMAELAATDAASRETYNGGDAAASDS